MRYTQLADVSYKNLFEKLRQLFCSEMLRLGASETYVDTFCGRTPKLVLARHYADHNPKRLKAIYEKANLKVLK
jgi:intergrase/recombinase